MIGRYAGPTAAQPDWNRNRDNHQMTTAKHRVDRRTVREIESALRVVPAPHVSFLARLRAVLVYAVLATPAVVSEFRRTHRGQWVEDIAFVAVLAVVGVAAGYAVVTWANA